MYDRRMPMPVPVAHGRAGVMAASRPPVYGAEFAPRPRALPVVPSAYYADAYAPSGASYGGYAPVAQPAYEPAYRRQVPRAQAYGYYEEAPVYAFTAPQRSMPAPSAYDPRRAAPVERVARPAYTLTLAVPEDPRLVPAGKPMARTRAAPSGWSHGAAPPMTSKAMHPSFGVASEEEDCMAALNRLDLSVVDQQDDARAASPDMFALAGAGKDWAALVRDATCFETSTIDTLSLGDRASSPCSVADVATPVTQAGQTAADASGTPTTPPSVSESDVYQTPSGQLCSLVCTAVNAARHPHLVRVL